MLAGHPVSNELQACFSCHDEIDRTCLQWAFNPKRSPAGRKLVTDPCRVEFLIAESSVTQQLVGEQKPQYAEFQPVSLELVEKMYDELALREWLGCHSHWCLLRHTSRTVYYWQSGE